jgi:Flp pilus assembly protein TadG
MDANTIRTTYGFVPVPRRIRAPHRLRRGQALAEFAIITVVIYLLVGGILTFGYALYVAQGLQQAADVAAREISRTPLPPELKLDEETASGNDDAVLYGTSATTAEVRSKVFDERYLVLTVDRPSLLDDEQTFNNGMVVGDLPILNQQLFPLMISDYIGNGDDQTAVIRYPGRVYEDPNPIDLNASGYLVDIPLTTNTAIRVVEEIDSDANPNPFQLSSEHRGIVALRINYPWHSPFMFGVDADNKGVAAETNPGLSQGPLGTGYGPYVGEQGFGKQAASDGWEFGVRPFRKLISGQAIYRREVFSSN